MRSSTILCGVCIFFYASQAYSYHLSHLLLSGFDNGESSKEAASRQEIKNDDISYELQHANFLKPYPIHRNRHLFHKNGRASKKKWRHELIPPEIDSKSIESIASNSWEERLYDIFDADLMFQEYKLLGKQRPKFRKHKIRHRHKHRQVGVQSDVSKIEDSTRNPGVIFRITKKAMDFFSSNVPKMLEEDLVGRPVADFNLMVLEQLNVTVHAIKIIGLEFPEVKYEQIFRDTLTLSTCSGLLELRGLYRSVYNTVREGQFKATINGFETKLKLKLSRTLDGKLKLQDKVCSLSIIRVDIELQPNLIDDVAEEIKSHLVENLASKICHHVDEYVDRMDQKLDSLLKVHSIQLEAGNEEIQLNTEVLTDVSIEPDFFDLELVGEFQRGSKRTPFQPSPIMKHDSDTRKMAYLYISEYMINSFFYQIDTYAFLRINLHRIPEIESFLRLACNESEDCLGRYFEWKDMFEPNTGRMEARPSTCPSVEITEAGALLKLNLTVDIGYQKIGAKARTVLLGFNLMLDLMTTSVDILTTEDGYYKIVPKVGTKELKVTSIKPYVEQMEDFAQDFDSFLYGRKTAIADMINQNFHRIFQLPLDLPFEAQDFSIHFRHKTAAIGFDLKLESTRGWFLPGKK